MRIKSRSLLERVARNMGRAPQSGPTSDPKSGPTSASSLLAQVATAYSAQPVIDEALDVAGFDPAAAALFEAVIEAAFLVANADGVFDAEERGAFQAVVATACDNVVQMRRLEALTADFAEQLAEDGAEKRARMIARAIADRRQQLEVIRIAGLMAQASGGVSDEERRVLDLLAQGFELDPGAVDEALAQAAAALELG
jgi:tellurite resistance protein